ncbi:hypothetical protein [Streptomyces sp. NPDC047070]|uniref:hypothetical protein n=1 Tax=Streptomyces sp. NPDC047070 TaxID=3154923 RepID=UPI0034572468
MIAWALAFTALGLALVAKTAMCAINGDKRGVAGWTGAASAMCSLANIIVRNQGEAAFHAGVTAIVLWLWWNSGGGDGTRRRLRRWTRAFHGTRRTAPTAAMTTPTGTLCRDPRGTAR